jgi:hypothetical protein
VGVLESSAFNSDIGVDSESCHSNELDDCHSYFVAAHHFYNCAGTGSDFCFSKSKNGYHGTRLKRKVVKHLQGMVAKNEPNLLR